MTYPSEGGSTGPELTLRASSRVHRQSGPQGHKFTKAQLSRVLELLELLVVRQRLHETLMEHAIVERLADARRFAGHVPRTWRHVAACEHDLDPGLMLGKVMGSREPVAVAGHRHV